MAEILASAHQLPVIGAMVKRLVEEYGVEGPTVIRMQPGETGLPEPSFLKAHFIQVLPKERLLDRLLRSLSARQLRALVACILRAVDPDAPYEP